MAQSFEAERITKSPMKQRQREFHLLWGIPKGPAKKRTSRVRQGSIKQRQRSQMHLICLISYLGGSRQLFYSVRARQACRARLGFACPTSLEHYQSLLHFADRSDTMEVSFFILAGFKIYGSAKLPDHQIFVSGIPILSRQRNAPRNCRWRSLYEPCTLD